MYSYNSENKTTIKNYLFIVLYMYTIYIYIYICIYKLYVYIHFYIHQNKIKLLK